MMKTINSYGRLTGLYEKKIKLLLLTSTLILGIHLTVFSSPTSTSINFGAHNIIDQDYVSGIVKDGAGIPIPGVNVIIKGTNQGTMTNMDGEFQITASTNDILVFSSIGFENQEIAVADEFNIEIVLTENVSELGEVVVVGYDTQRKITSTSAVSSVKGEEIEDVPVGNITSALAGRVPGLQVMNRGGQPGADGAFLNIRGFGAPLILVDGVPQDPGNIDPNEIESINVLKDASASVYGARAGNGVILVTTKRGVLGKPTFSFNYSSSISEPTKIVELADAPTYARLVNQADLSNGVEPTYSEEEISLFEQGTNPQYPNTDWWDETFRKWAPMNDFNLNVRGGTENVKYFLSAGYLNQESILRTNDINFERFSFRSNLDAQISETFEIGVDISGRKEYRNTPGRGIDVIMLAVQAAKPTEPASFPDSSRPTYPGYDAGWANPLPISNRDYSGYTNDNFQSIRGTLNMNYDMVNFIKGLNVELKADYRANDSFIKNWSTPFTYYNYNYEEDTYQESSVFNSGRTSLNQNYRKDWLAYGYLRFNYNRSFNDHKISAMVLGEALASRADYFGAYREGFITDEIDQLFAGSDENKDNNGGASEDGRMSYVGTLGYNFKNKYLADFVLRADGSSRFYEDNRWGYFPAISVGWRINEEDFFKNNIDSFDNLKLRMSYGQAGDEATVMFNYLTGYQFASSYVFGQNETIERGIASRGLANPAARWAQTTTYNIGLDGNIDESALYFEVDAFYRRKSDILATRVLSVPSTFGASLPQENINSQDDRGFELLLGHSGNIGEFNYDVSANFSWARSKWIHFEEPEFVSEEERRRRQLSGQWTNISWGYETDGLFTTQEEIDNWADITNGANNNVIRPGDIKYIDQNEDGVINWMDEVQLGKTVQPEIFYGMNLNLEYKNFGLTALLQGAANYSVFYSDQFKAPFGVNFVPFQFWEDAWTTENPNPQSSLPRIRYGAQMTHPNGYASDFWIVENAYFIRLKDVQLSYTLPNSIVESIGFQNIRLYAQGYNLAAITNVRYRDPESDNSSGRNYPHQRTLSIGANLKF
ncbi:SusC/RagA family TonB-linked outer membrane protein [Autumnicola musiva]|uniref:TonB-dependent receptor n=1 Tax=Autumnicola musiva TaxID=3075589 RepID=A0ABU3DAE9_9FLAO|nr:TonB-dependent receptor [Zunongwangia sp. F117]MDT0678503.1 TonB-dependent receptor [Zunongwangia sp. F117]